MCALMNDERVFCLLSSSLKNQISFPAKIRDTFAAIIALFPGKTTGMTFPNNLTTLQPNKTKTNKSVP